MKTSQKFAIYRRYAILNYMGWVPGLGWLTRQQITCMHYDARRGVPSAHVARRLVIDNLCSQHMHDFSGWGLFYAMVPKYEILPSPNDPRLIAPEPIEAYRYRECLRGCGACQRQNHSNGKVEDYRREN